MKKDTAVLFVTESERYPVVSESASEAIVSYFNFHVENMILNTNIIPTHIIIMIEKTGIINQVIQTEPTIARRSGTKLKAKVSVKDSNERLNRPTFCTKLPLKLLAKKVYECLVM